MSDNVKPLTDAALRERLAALEKLIGSPEIDDWFNGVRLESVHQVDLWQEHDGRKTPWDWFWTVRFLAQKAADAADRGDVEKAKHHTITVAAALWNWHRALSDDAPTLPPLRLVGAADV